VQTQIQFRRGRCKEADHQHQGHDGHILEQKYGQACPAFDRIDLHPIHQHPQHHGGGTQRQDGPQCKCAWQTHHGKHDQGNDYNGQYHLQGTPTKCHASHFEQLFKAEFQADGKQQHGHAQFRSLVDRLCVKQQGADNGAGQEVPQYGALSQTLGNGTHEKGAAQ